MAATSFLNWNWAGEHVQAELTNGEYVSAESTLLLAGPSRLDMLSGSAGDGTIEFVKSQLYPIGLVQNFMMAQNRFLTRLFEIGSKRAYFVTGRLAVNFQLNRIIFFGPSLIRMLYALAPAGSDGTVAGGNKFTFVQEGQPGASLGAALQTPTNYAKLFPSRYLVPTGYGGKPGEDNRDFFINMASDLLQIPFGLGAIFKDAKNRPYGACYLQESLLEAHSMGVDANNVVIAEGCNGQCDRVEPVQLISAI